MALQLLDRPWSDHATIRLSSGEPPRPPRVPPEETCELRALLEGAWPGEARLVGQDGFLHVHAVIVRGDSDLEAVARSGGDHDGAVLGARARHAYGCGTGGAALRRRLLTLSGGDGVVVCGKKRHVVHRCVLAARNAYFAAAFAHSNEATAPPGLEDVSEELIRYAYTAHDRELGILVDAAGIDDAHQEPRAVRVVFGLDELLFETARDAVAARLAESVHVTNAASLLVVADRIDSPTLRTACLATLAEPGGVKAARAADPELFDELVPPAVQRQLEHLAVIARTNPVGRGRLTDVREAIAMLREALDEQRERLAAARNTQRRLERDGRPDAAHSDLLDARTKRLDYLRDYVETQEARLFGGGGGGGEAAQEPMIGDEEATWCYEWRPIGPTTVLPPGLEIRLVFGGSKKARVPPVWPIRIALPNQGARFRRDVDRNTTVADILEDLRTELGPNITLVDAQNATIDPSRTCDPDLWTQRNRLSVRIT